MKYLKKFENEEFVRMFLIPNVVLAEDTDKILYNVDSSGVYIQHIDGTLFTTEQWTARAYTSDLANGVAVCTLDTQFVIAKNEALETGGAPWSGNSNTAIEGVMLTSDEDTAKKDYAGAANTALIAAASAIGAAKVCAEFTFPNGAKGHLPSLGEWAIALANKSKVDEAMSLIGGEDFVMIHSYWSSTQYSATMAWRILWDYGTLRERPKSEAGSVWAFSALSL